MRKVNVRLFTLTSDAARSNIRCPAGNTGSYQMCPSKSAPCHPHPDSYRRHSTHHPHHKQSSRRNHSLILPSSHRSSRPTILNIYDNTSVCKGVPRMKSREKQKIAPNAATDRRFGAISRKRTVHPTNTRA